MDTESIAGTPFGYLLAAGLVVAFGGLLALVNRAGRRDVSKRDAKIRAHMKLDEERMKAMRSWKKTDA